MGSASSSIGDIFHHGKKHHSCHDSAAYTQKGRDPQTLITITPAHSEIVVYAVLVSQTSQTDCIVMDIQNGQLWAMHANVDARLVANRQVFELEDVSFKLTQMESGEVLEYCTVNNQKADQMADQKLRPVVAVVSATFSDF